MAVLQKQKFPLTRCCVLHFSVAWKRKPYKESTEKFNFQTISTGLLVMVTPKLSSKEAPPYNFFGRIPLKNNAVMSLKGYSNNRQMTLRKKPSKLNCQQNSKHQFQKKMNSRLLKKCLKVDLNHVLSNAKINVNAGSHYLWCYFFRSFQ